jgi:hypothetical protein
MVSYYNGHKNGRHPSFRVNQMSHKCHIREGEINSYTMKRLDQGHFHPKQKVPGLTCPGQKSNPGLEQGEASTLEKSHSNSLLIAI